MYDVLIIGAGVIGSACARELSRYCLNIAVLEKEEDVCCGTSKANSAIIHSGIDCKPGTWMARMNVKGNEMMDALSKDLDFPFQRNGSLIVCYEDNDLPHLQALYQQGVQNKIPDIRILTKAELHEMEPNIAKDAVAAIFAPTGGIVCPFGMNIAMAENAADNGVKFLLHTEVMQIEKSACGYLLLTNQGSIEARCVVNAAGVYADKFHNMVSSEKIHITPRRGEYCLLDKTAGEFVSKTIFKLPGSYGKGILITPTVHGNILLGPTASYHDDKDATNTTPEGLSHICDTARQYIPDIPLREIITSFSGNRAHEDGHEFIISEVADAPLFIDAAGIESPGLTSAPAIGARVAGIVCSLLHPRENLLFNGTRKGVLNPKTLTKEAYAALIKEKPSYGNIICRCEMITEGEILDAVHRTLGASSLDGVKRRTRAGMGRCQSGFCAPKTMGILARELHLDPLALTKSGGASTLLTSYTKKSFQEADK